MPGDRWEAEVAARMTDIGERLGARPGHMFGYPALYAGRRLVVCAYGSGLGLKLPSERVRELIDTGRAGHFQPYGKAPMPEWAHVPAADDLDELTDLITEALEFTRMAGT